MGILYEKVLKIRENGRSLKPVVISEKVKPPEKSNLIHKADKIRKEEINQKPKETAVKDDDERAGGKP